MSDSDNNPVEDLFGDDAGFLSWLGIEVEEEKNAAKKQWEVSQTPKNGDKDDKKETVDENKKNKGSKKPNKSKKMDFSKAPWDSSNDAVVVKKAVEKKLTSTKNFTVKKWIVKKKKDSSEVDDLIKKKSWWGFMSGIESWTSRASWTWTRSTWGWWRARWSTWWARGGARWRTGWGWWGRWRGGPGRWARGGQRWWGRFQRRDDGKLQLWRTARTVNTTTTSTKDIIARKTKSQKTYQVSDNLKRKETISMENTITVKEFSEKMWVPLSEVMKVLLANRIVVAAQASIDFDTAQLVWTEFDVTVVRATIEMNVEDILEANLETILAQDKEATDLIERPPVVTVMGHVDHGKTRLLDHLRKSDVVAGEAWGITQSIWASQIVHNDKKITFIDTPGHELFSAIRARGSKITNIVIIVVAADDGVKPQTVEAIRHAKDAWVPIIVAITKIDLGNKNMEKIKGQLAEHELTPEDWGWDTMIIPCSAVSGQGIDDLLEGILLQTEMLHLQYSPSRPAVWVVIESNKDAQQWVMTTLLVMSGTLRVWDIVVVHDTFGKVKRMSDRTWNQIKEARWGDAIMILGINEVPEPGRLVEVVASEKVANKKVAEIKEHANSHIAEAALQNVLDRIWEWETAQLKLIMKADSYGSLEAAKHAITTAKLEENVEIKVIHNDVGAITDSDLSFAKAWWAIVVGFNLPITGAIRKKSDQLNVTVKQFDIIYELISYLEDISKWLIEIEKVETLIGKMKVLALFFKKWKEMIVWGRIIEWRAENQATFKVMRWEDQRATGKINSLQKEQNSVKIVKEWHECGIKIRTSKKVMVDDIIEFYLMEAPTPEMIQAEKEKKKKMMEAIAEEKLAEGEE